MQTERRFYPVSSPDIGPLEQEYIRKAVESGWVSSIGEFVDRFEREFASFCGVEHGVAMTNGTDSLFIALRALGIGPGDEVIVPSLTFVAVPAVVSSIGAEPVIVDVHPDYWCLDPAVVERAITRKTKAIVVVHVYGHPADMDPILDIARPRGIRIVEDCAEAHGAKYKGKKVGSIGDVGCFSFYGNKIITTGEGGMAITSDGDLMKRMRFLKDHAMDPERRYFHPEVGYNCRMTNLQAAMGCAQLERIKELIAKRSLMLKWYREALSDIPSLILNPKMTWAEPVNWMVCAVLDKDFGPSRDGLLEYLKNLRVDTRPFFIPIERMPPYKMCKVVGKDSDKAKVSASLTATGFNLPSSSILSQDDINFFVASIKKFFENVK